MPVGEVRSIGPGCVVATTPVGPTSDGWPSAAIRKALSVLLAVFETSIAKMRVFRVPEFLGAALMLGLLATLLLFVSRSL